MVLLPFQALKNNQLGRAAWEELRNQLSIDEPLNRERRYQWMTLLDTIPMEYSIIAVFERGLEANDRREVEEMMRDAWAGFLDRHSEDGASLVNKYLMFIDSWPRRVKADFKYQRRGLPPIARGRRRGLVFTDSERVIARSNQYVLYLI